MISRTATISPDGRYRYELQDRPERDLFEPHLGPITFVMLNPSTADATHDDPTMRRVMTFSRGHSMLRVVNLYALRSPNPADLKKVPLEEAVGPLNDAHIESALGWADTVVLAWGTNVPHPARARHVLRSLERIGKPAVSLGHQTVSGHPQHPLFVPNGTPMTFFPLRTSHPVRWPGGALDVLGDYMHSAREIAQEAARHIVIAGIVPAADGSFVLDVYEESFRVHLSGGSITAVKRMVTSPWRKQGPAADPGLELQRVTLPDVTLP